LAWQCSPGRDGTPATGVIHPFLVSDVVVGLLLVVAAVWPGERGPAAAMLAGFAAMGGVFLSATSGRLLLGNYRDLGTVLTTLGLVPCLARAIALGHRLAGERGTWLWISCDDIRLVPGPAYGPFQRLGDVN
jgi:hypothetical protein